MNTVLLKVASLLPWFKLAKWLLAELEFKLKVSEYLAAETDWYFKLAAIAWSELTGKNPEDLKAILLASSQR